MSDKLASKWMKWKDVPVGEHSADWQRRLGEALKDDSRPGYLIALLSAYFGSRGADCYKAGCKQEADLFFSCGGSLTTANEKIDRFEKTYSGEA